ncbi:hypothetical protein [Paraburkholderia phenoliruptrix]|uniref:hypothetical protein n=1 Tax=Paraburkholderia phenoliruptrix TaxID=252970 RepID=UPI001C4EC5C6|nr:hypothetical protein [Paraburkholderia phenoliruptrix]MBW0449243.1 hypothetical protein [Paraburkholderia phenoliruptrix]MBW9097523.1 hypothetical protein [Paraburkholderia phenoliruptrix]
MTADIDEMRATLGELAAMAAQCDRAEREILARALERIDVVQAQLAHEHAGSIQHADLVEERGVLLQVIARARQTLNAG